MASIVNDRSSIRRHRLISDIDLIRRACLEDKNSPFCKFEYNNDWFLFEYQSGTTRIFYQVSLSESYPDGSIMTSCVNASDSQHETTYFNDRLPVMFNRLASKMYKPLDLDVDDSPAGADEDVNREDGNVSAESDDDDDACDVIADDIDTDDVDDSLCVDPELMRDIEFVKSIYGVDAITCRYFKVIDDVDIELSIPTTSLDVEVSKAWKLLYLQPLIILLHCSMSRYRTGQVPTVEVFQYSSDGNREKSESGIHKQMQKIMERYFVDWDNWSKPQNVDKAVHDSSSRRNQNQPKPVYSDADVWKLMKLGYTKSASIYALEAFNGDIQQACDMLLDSGDDMPSEPAWDDGVIPSSSALQQLTIELKKDKKRSSSKTKHGFLVQTMKYAVKRLATLSEYCVVCDQRHVFENSSMLKPVVCSRELCIFAFQTLGVMADAADEVATGAEVVDLLVAMAKAAVKSSRKELIFEPYPSVVDPHDKYQLAFNPKTQDFDLVDKTLMNIPPTQEMMVSSGYEWKKTMDECDPLAYPLLQWIISSNRCHIVKLPPEKQLKFMQTPHQFLLRSSPPAKEAAFVEAKRKHYSKFAFHGSHIENWHSIIRRGLLNASNTQLQVNGTAYGSGIYLSPNSSVSFEYSRSRHVVLRRPVQQPDSRKSRKKKSKKPDVPVHQFLTSDDITCIALCEVVTSSDLQIHHGVWVMPDPDQVCTRFFFVYENGPPTNCNIDCQSSGVFCEIKRVMSMIYT